ncbi:hypothetical protein ACFL6R_00995 [Gemmatimonadota bacterium]
MLSKGILILTVTSPILVSFSQVLLKLGANKFGDANFFRQYFNFYVICAYFLFGVVTVINVYIFTELPLSVGTLMIALSYIGVVILGYFVLNEKLPKNKFLGVIYTVIGMIIFWIGM